MARPPRVRPQLPLFAKVAIPQPCSRMSLAQRLHSSDECGTEEDWTQKPGRHHMGYVTAGSIFVTAVLGAVIGVLTLTPPTGLEMPAGSDKLSHLLAFAALAIPLSIVKPRWNVALFAACLAYGAAIELVQPYVGRSREWADLVADMLGITGGLLIALLIRRNVPRLFATLTCLSPPDRQSPDQ